jgi:CDGSH-type Zn-finger protein
VLTRPDVFVPNAQGEWIHPDSAEPEEVAELAHLCPSGAIRYQRFDGGPEEVPPNVNLTRLRENGPLAVHAKLELGSADVGYRVTLCRCGASQNKPFCDGSHNAVGFRASGEPETKPSEVLTQRDGPLKVTPLPDGPLLFEGNLELVSGTGRTFNRLTRTKLCRCGQSSNKPYCDGTHLKVGFQAP